MSKRAKSKAAPKRTRTLRGHGEKRGPGSRHGTGKPHWALDAMDSAGRGGVNLGKVDAMPVRL